MIQFEYCLTYFDIYKNFLTIYQDLPQPKRILIGLEVLKKSLHLIELSQTVELE